MIILILTLTGDRSQSAWESKSFINLYNSPKRADTNHPPPLPRILRKALILGSDRSCRLQSSDSPPSYCVRYL